MKLCELLDVSCLKINLAATTKVEALEELVDLLLQAGRLHDREGALNALIARESLQSTGIGHGIAVPHAKHESIKTLTAALGISKRGVAFNAIDEQPVRVVFLVLASTDETGPHVQALGEIARLLQLPGFFEKLTAAGSPSELLAAIAAEE